jgi:hypothetical protein
VILIGKSEKLSDFDKKKWKFDRKSGILIENGGGFDIKKLIFTIKKPQKHHFRLKNTTFPINPPPKRTLKPPKTLLKRPPSPIRFRIRPKKGPPKSQNLNRRPENRRFRDWVFM